MEEVCISWIDACMAVNAAEGQTEIMASAGAPRKENWESACNLTCGGSG